MPLPPNAKSMPGKEAKTGRRPPLRPRRFIPAQVSVDAFLTRLTRAGARYVVLRWFETLPRVAPGEDIDLLIADEDLPLVEPMLLARADGPRSQKVDLYSVSGLRGTDFAGVPYFTRQLAHQILEGGVLLRSKYCVPCPADHFLSLAFHAVYHKGESSGLPATAGDPLPAPNPDHDYHATLARLAAHLREPVDLTLDGLDRYLAGRGLRPAVDLLDRYQRRNAWLRRRLAEQRHDIGRAAGLITFIVRDAGVPYLEEIQRIIARDGFELLQTFRLTEAEKARVRTSVRGGNWEAGPFPVSAGEPDTVVIAYDFNYRPDPAADGQLVNKNSTLAKRDMRRLVTDLLPPSGWFNPVHSTDNGWQSLETLRVIGRSGLDEEVTRQIGAIERDVELPWPVIRSLSSKGRRARVMLVDHPQHGRVVAKIFRPGAIRYFERELMARRDLHGVGGVPALIDHGKNWLLTPLYSDTKAHVLRNLPGSRQVQLTREAVLALTALVDALRSRHYFLLDLSTHNLVTDSAAGLLVIDFEFLQKYSAALPPPEDDYSVTGIAPDADYDVPVYEKANQWHLGVRSSVFHPAICGLPARQLFGAPDRTGLRVKMAALQAWWWAAFALHRRWRLLSKRLAPAAARRALRRLVLPSSEARGPKVEPSALVMSSTVPRPLTPRSGPNVLHFGSGSVRQESENSGREKLRAMSLINIDLSREQRP